MVLHGRLNWSMDRDTYRQVSFCLDHMGFSTLCIKTKYHWLKFVTIIRNRSLVTQYLLSSNQFMWGFVEYWIRQHRTENCFQPYFDSSNSCQLMCKKQLKSWEIVTTTLQQPAACFCYSVCGVASVTVLSAKHSLRLALSTAELLLLSPRAWAA